MVNTNTLAPGTTVPSNTVLSGTTGWYTAHGCLAGHPDQVLSNQLWVSV